MPNTKNFILRCMVLDELLSDRHHYYDIHDLVEKVNDKLEKDCYKKVTRRCIEKDLKDIEYEPFYAELETYPAAGKICKRYKDPEFSIFKKKLSNDEKLLLKEVLGTLGQFDGLDNFTWLGTLAKGLGVKTKEPIIEFSTSPMGQSPFLGQLFTAISNHVAVELTYKKFNVENTQQIIIHPYKLKQYNNRWYVLGVTNENYLTGNYPLDRIIEIVERPEIKFRKTTEDITEQFEDVIGVTVHQDRPVERIILWASDEAYPYIETKPMHVSFKPIRGEKADALRAEHPKLSGGHFFQIECKENYELIRELCSFGKELLVLSPQHIQDTVFNRISSHNNEYINLRT